LTRARCIAAVFLALLGSRPALADDPPVVARDSIRVTASRIDGVWKNGKQGPGASWLPAIEFRINGPIADGNHYSIDFTLPGNKPWVTFECPDVTVEVKQRSWWKTECGALTTNRDPSIKESKSVATTGTFGFVIRVRNEKSGTKATLFTGKVKVGKLVPNPKEPLEVEFYVDDDWRIPIGYLGFEEGAMTKAARARYETDDSSVLLAGMEFRGKPGEVKGQLFYQGVELAQDICQPGSDEDFDPSKPVWREVQCKFNGVYKTEPTAGGHGLDKNPGDYEIKVLAGGKMARSIKFAVGADGSIDGVAASSRLGSERGVVPVQVVGNQGPWDKTAWKAGAFYGNPLTGFKAAP
jgi:hypothetical protein